MKNPHWTTKTNWTTIEEKIETGDGIEYISWTTKPK